MSYEVVKRGEWPHKHSYPPRGAEPVGTIIRCDCGQQFILKHVAYADSPKWRICGEVPPPRPPEER